MKNLHYLKKFVVMVLAAMMTLSTFALPTFAAATADVSIEGLDAGATVKLYKIVKYEDGNWKTEDGVTIADVTDPQAGEITKITNDLTAGDLSLDVAYEGTADADGKFTKNVAPGMYLALATSKNGDVVYNPMILAINYDANGQAINDNNNIKLPSDFKTAYAKQSKPTLDKTVDWVQKGSTAVDKNGNTLTAGDRANFKIATQIPSYSEAYTDPVFWVHDKIDPNGGLEDIKDVVVKVGGTTLTEGENYTIEKKTSDDKTGVVEFTVKFKNNGEDKFMWKPAARDVEITYTAKLNKNAFNSGFNPNVNDCDIKYSNDPTDGDSYGTDEDDTKTYTFNIDGELFGPDGTSLKDKTTEVIKVEEKKENGEVVTKMVTKTIETEKNGIKTDVLHPLAGAEFELLDANKKQIRTAITDENGRFVADDNHTGFLGLGVGTYYIKETKAPTGYALVNTEVEVVIDAEIDQETGLLQSYEITIGGAKTKYSLVNDSTTQQTTVVREETSETYLFPNSQVGTLPSTGGMGTVLFTVGGVAIMAIALFLLFGGKKKQQQ